VGFYNPCRCIIEAFSTRVVNVLSGPLNGNIMEKSNFDRLLERYTKDQVSEEEKNKIEAWLDLAKTESKRNFIWEKEDQEELFKKITSNIDHVDEILSFKPKKARSMSISNGGLLGIAAAVVLVIIASYVIWNSTAGVSILEQTTPLGEIEKVILNDGSIVWLHKGSKLTYFLEPNTGMRHAVLSGQGLFEVAKDPLHPFIISCGDIFVKVLGTSFKLKTDQDQIELEVLTGIVNLSSAKDAVGINVEPNELAIYSVSGVLARTKIGPPELTDAAAGTEYDMSFRNTEMHTVLERIQSKFEVTVVVADPEVNACRITADFTDRSLDVTLEMISEILDVHYKVNGKSVAISGKGCH